MVQSRYGFRLLHEPDRVVVACIGVNFRILEDGLDRDTTPKRGVESLVDDAHGTAPEDATDLVAAESGKFRR